MDLVEWFGDRVTTLSLKHPKASRKLLLTGYRLNKQYITSSKNRKTQPRSRIDGAADSMQMIIAALAHPEKAALTSIFTPSEPLAAAGIIPYSLEAISSYLVGTHCENFYQQTASEHGVSESLCSFHRTFIGAMETGLVPKPPFIIFTSLACDGNMITFPSLAKIYDVPYFFIDVPYERSEDSVRDVARQIEEMTHFIEDQTHKKISMDKLSACVARSGRCREYYRKYLRALKKKRLPGTGTDEMYGAFMSHLLLGTRMSENYFSRLLKDIEKQPDSNARRLVWIHIIPYMQPAYRNLMNGHPNVFVTSVELCYDGLLVPQDPEDPFGSMARRLVYSGYNGPAQHRIDNGIKIAKETGSDGFVIFAHWGCKETLGAAELMKEGFEDAGYPAMILDGDAACPANTGDGQMATRLEAFIEMIGGQA